MILRNRSTRIAAGALLLICVHALEVQSASWFDPDWQRRVRLTVDPAAIADGETFVDFTLLLSVAEPHLSSVLSSANPDGSDLVVTAGDGVTILPHELVSFDRDSRSGELWFKADLLSPTNNVFYLYYQNPEPVGTPLLDSAWRPDHLAVYHFEEVPGTGVVLDSGPGSGTNPAIPGANSTWTADDHVSGPIGRAWRFDGVTDWLSTEISSTDSSYTISTWYTNSEAVDKGMVALQSESGYWDISLRRREGHPFPELRTRDGYVNWFPDVVDTAAHHYAWVIDRTTDTTRFYLDGVEQLVRYFVLDPGNESILKQTRIEGLVGIAGPIWYNALDLTCGIVDEFRIVEGIRDAAWIATEYANQSEPAIFYDYVDEVRDNVTAAETGPSGSMVGAISVWPNPFQGRARIDVESAGPSLQLRVYDASGRLVRTLPTAVSRGNATTLFWDGRDDHGTLVSSGTYYFQAQGTRATAGTKVLLIR